MKKRIRKPTRVAAVRRKTKETDIQVRLDLDGAGKSRVKTGIGFLDHMLTLFAKHGMFDVELRAKGDLEVDRHHTNEDAAITLGKAFFQALDDKAGICRYGFFYLPMGETLVRVALDISGRPAVYLTADVKFNQRGENYKLEDAEHFLESFCQQAGINLHVNVLAGKHHHHVIEGIFKGFARALDAATRVDPRVHGIPSTKGTL
ncbi:MAG: imidazoleglycerol-phosphate dehydratase HisB [Candidatus Omnitrophica bacterium]|nr:imidazoleglycerol-phosphate dehydratase HisB [Candidatus Omnitrophota bacterium]